MRNELSQARSAPPEIGGAMWHCSNAARLMCNSSRGHVSAGVGGTSAFHGQALRSIRSNGAGAMKMAPWQMQPVSFSHFGIEPKSCEAPLTSAHRTCSITAEAASTDVPMQWK